MGSTSTLRGPRAIALGLVVAIGSAGVPRASRAEEGLSLDRAVELALETSPAIRVEDARLRATRADRTAALGAFLPTLAGGVSYDRLAADRLAPSGGAASSGLFEQEAFAGIGLSQLVFDRGAIARYSAARRSIAVQAASCDVSRLETVFLVTEAYYRAAEARVLVRAAEDSQERHRRFERLALDSLEAGRGTRLDATRATAARLEASAALVRARELERIARVALTSRLGLERVVERLVDELPGTVAPPPDESQMVARALGGSPDLARLERREEQAESGLDVARGALWPRIRAHAGYGYRWRDIGDGADEWAVGVSLDLAVFDLTSQVAAVDRARSELAERGHELRSGALELERQVRETVGWWRIAAAQDEAAEARIDSAQEALSAAEALWEVGRATALDVLTAQSDLTRALGDRAGALATYAIARARLVRLTGLPA